MSIHTRWMIRCDMPEVIDIDAKSFEHPWDNEKYVQMLRQRNCVGLIAESGNMVVATMLYELHARTLEVIRLAVHPDHLRKGLGREMIAKVVSKLSAGRRPTAVVHVAEANLSGQMFLKSLGFCASEVVVSEGGSEYRFSMSLGMEWPTPKYSVVTIGTSECDICGTKGRTAQMLSGGSAVPISRLEKVPQYVLLCEACIKEGREFANAFNGGAK